MAGECVPGGQELVLLHIGSREGLCPQSQVCVSAFVLYQRLSFQSPFPSGRWYVDSLYILVF